MTNQANKPPYLEHIRERTAVAAKNAEVTALRGKKENEEYDRTLREKTQRLARDMLPDIKSEIEKMADMGSHQLMIKVLMYEHGGPDSANWVKRLTYLGQAKKALLEELGFKVEWKEWYAKSVGSDDGGYYGDCAQLIVTW